jgi:hypothetical protein
MIILNWLVIFLLVFIASKQLEETISRYHKLPSQERNVVREYLSKSFFLLTETSLIVAVIYKTLK